MIGFKPISFIFNNYAQPPTLPNLEANGIDVDLYQLPIFKIEKKKREKIKQASDTVEKFDTHKRDLN